jgi:hypothetical protein
VGVRSFSRGLHVANGGDGPAGTKRVFRSAHDKDGHGTQGGGVAMANASLLGNATSTLLTVWACARSP